MAIKNKEIKNESTTRYIVHGFLTSTTTPYTDRYKQLLGKATELNSAELYAEKTHSKYELNSAEFLLNC